MNDELALIGEAARGILARPVDPRAPWEPLIAGGWIGMAVDEARGGQGGTLEQAAVVARAAGATAVAAPVVEAILAAITLGACAPTRELLTALADGSERAALVPQVVWSDRSGCVADQELVVAWGRHATVAVLVAMLAEGGLGLAVVPLAETTVIAGESLAGDPLDRLILPSAQLPAEMHPLDLPLDRLIEAAAVLTAARLCGALRRVAELSVEHANQRVQFGRSIGSFQAIAHALAQQEAAVALAEGALSGALADPGRAGCAEAARVAAGAAVDPVTKAAHQVHGALGVTREHELHRYTLRLVGWRSDFGPARWWSRRLGRRALRAASWWDELAPTLISQTTV